MVPRLLTGGFGRLGTSLARAVRRSDGGRRRVSTAGAGTSAGGPKQSRPATVVLERPTRFNPPSHGARLPRKRRRHYGGDLSAAEELAQKVQNYPGMMAPDGSWSYWFWHSRALHLTITVVRSCLALDPNRMIAS